MTALCVPDHPILSLGLLQFVSSVHIAPAEWQRNDNMRYSPTVYQQNKRMCYTFIRRSPESTSEYNKVKSSKFGMGSNI